MKSVTHCLAFSWSSSVMSWVRMFTSREGSSGFASDSGTRSQGSHIMIASGKNDRIAHRKLYVEEGVQLEPTYTYAAKVLKVVDADTYDVEIDLGFCIHAKVRVRLLAVDTPETYGVKKESEEYKRGMAAKWFAMKWLGLKPDPITGLHPVNCEVIVRSVDGKPLGQGKYGRWLAEIERPDGSSLNQALLDEGHAESVTY